MAERSPRCLIGTLYAGENELAACEAALHDQSYRHWEHFRLDHLPEWEAHERLYETFMARRREFDLCVKLDADMVLISPDVLREMVMFMARRPGVDDVTFAVHDYLSDCLILGLHVFTHRAIWHAPEHAYQPDQDPDIPGERLRCFGPPAPVARHACDPSRYQAFHFGAHRMLKALHPRVPRLAVPQWSLMHGIARHARRNPDARLRLALLGGWHVWKGELGSDAKEMDAPAKRRLFSRYEEGASSELDRAIPFLWPWFLAYRARCSRIADLARRAMHRAGRILLAVAPRLASVDRDDPRQRSPRR